MTERVGSAVRASMSFSIIASAIKPGVRLAVGELGRAVGSVIKVDDGIGISDTPHRFIRYALSAYQIRFIGLSDTLNIKINHHKQWVRCYFLCLY